MRAGADQVLTKSGTQGSGLMEQPPRNDQLVLATPELRRGHDLRGNFSMDHRYRASWLSISSRIWLIGSLVGNFLLPVAVGEADES